MIVFGWMGWHGQMTWFNFFVDHQILLMSDISDGSEPADGAAALSTGVKDDVFERRSGLCKTLTFIWTHFYLFKVGSPVESWPDWRKLLHHIPTKHRNKLFKIKWRLKEGGAQRIGITLSSGLFTFSQSKLQIVKTKEKKIDKLFWNVKLHLFWKYARKRPRLYTSWDDVQWVELLWAASLD